MAANGPSSEQTLAELSSAGNAALDVLSGVLVDVVHLAEGAQHQAEALTERLKPVLNWLPRAPIATRRLWPDAVIRSAGERWRGERRSLERAAGEQLAVLIPRLLNAILDHVDLNAIVLQRVDLNRVASNVDADAIVARVDIDAIADRLDLDRAISRVDVQPVVAAIDVDAIVAQVDLDRILDRVDLVGIARALLDELDLPEIIRQSSNSMASDAVRGIRLQSMEADQKVGRAFDRILLRRDHGGHGAANDISVPNVQEGHGGASSNAGHSLE